MKFTAMRLLFFSKLGTEPSAQRLRMITTEATEVRKCFQISFSRELLEFRLYSMRRGGFPMRSSRFLPTYLCLFAAFILAAFSSCCWAQSSGAPQYHLAKKVVLGGEGGWDYFTADPATHKIFIARGSYVMVLDPDGKVTAKIEVGKDNEAHAVALAPDIHRAFTSNGDGSSVTIFDPESLKVMSEVKIPGPRDTDDIMYEPATKRVFTFNGGKGNDSSAIDAVKGTVVGKIPLGGKPETAQTDGQGHIYVNIEDKSE